MAPPAPPLLLLLLPLGLAATGHGSAGVTGAVAGAEAAVASGSGSLPRGAPPSLVGIAGGRAQRRAGPCGKSLDPPEWLQVLGLPGGGPPSWGDLLHQSPPAPTGPPAPTAPTATSPGPVATDQLSTIERYVLGSVAGLALALCPLVALALLRCPLCHRAQRWLQPLLLGLAAGALSGDALLHLLPQALGVHDHGEGSQPHGEGSQPHGEGGAGAPWKALAALGGLFAFFLLEKVLGGLRPPGEAKVEDAELSQGPGEPQSGGPPPALVALARGAHALADGLALGAAFAASWQSGVGAGLALLCHEGPHALGTAAVLRRAGLRGRRALALALGGAVPVLPGLYAGLALGGIGPARAWLAALGSGLMLYLALCDMVPAMVAAQDPHPWRLLGLQSGGLLGGWGLLLLLALYEEGAFA